MEQVQVLEIGATQDDGPSNFVMHGGSSQAPQDDGPSNFVMHGGLSQAPQDVMDGAPSNPIQLEEPRLRRKVTGKKPISREKKSNFSTKEDVFLVNSWLQISCDPTINTEHKKEKFWERIAAEYNCKRGPYPQRSLCSLQSRWDVIMAENSKFLGYMTKAFYKNPSGMTDAEKTSLAATPFAEGKERPFMLLHCWEIMKHNPEWQDAQNRGTADAPSSLNTVDLEHQQPTPTAPSVGKSPDW